MSKIKIKSKQESGIRKQITEKGHYDNIRIKGFRLFDDTTFDNLARINIFFGPNNSGKTSVLEAVFTHACGMNFTNAITNLIARRTSNVSSYFDIGKRTISIFRKIDNSSCTYNIEATLGGKTRKLTATFNPSSELSILDPKNISKLGLDFKFDNQQPMRGENSSSGSILFNNLPINLNLPKKLIGSWINTFEGKRKEVSIYSMPTQPLLFSPNIIQTHFIQGVFGDITSHRENTQEIAIYSHLKSYGLIKDFVDQMKKSFPIIVDLDAIPYPDGSATDIVAITDDGKRLSMSNFGDGMRRWLNIFGGFVVHQNAVHCIEEVDATFHHEALEKLSHNLIDYSKKYNNQLFLTSHSMEFADIFLKSIYENREKYFDNGVDPVRIYTLNPVKDGEERKIEVWSMTGAEAYEKRQKFSLELR